MQVRSFGFAVCALAAQPVLAGPPKVVADIAPVHGLAAMVMQGVAEPALLVPPGASPHSFALRPSDARALSEADIVVAIGPALGAWQDRVADALAPGAVRITLLDVPGTHLLDFRDSDGFGAHDHDDEDHAEEDHDEHDEHADEGHDDHDEHDKHADEGHGDHDDPAEEDHTDHAEDGHAHSGTDPHAWLDPANALVWIGALQEALAQADPGNAAVYAANADAARAKVASAADDTAARLAPLSGASFVVFHDAYHYFEDAFGLPAAGAISLSDAAAPSAARLAETRAIIADAGVGCVFSEPQFSPRLIGAVTEGVTVTVTELDPLGAEIAPGPDLYPALIRAMGVAFETCLK